MRKSALYFGLAIFILSQPAAALTFKSDGSIVQNDGTVVSQSTQAKYLEALEKFRAGEPVTGF
ncbi:MAG: hypothetical protein ACON4G_08415, partial [Candidatus Puniceispirillaceae bacterium]